MELRISFENTEKMCIDRPKPTPILIIGVMNSTKKDGTLGRDGQNGWHCKVVDNHDTCSRAIDKITPRICACLTNKKHNSLTKR